MRRELIAAVLLSISMAAASALAVVLVPKNYLADRFSRQKFADIVPKQFAGWEFDKSIVPVQPSPELQQVLDATYDEVLTATYRNAAGQRIMLSLAYGRNQHRGMNTHRPEVCYPAQGFRVVKSGFVSNLTVKAPGDSEFMLPVTRLVAAMGSRNEPISYWLMVGDRITSFGYGQRWAAIKDGLKGDIPDGVLVRVSSIGENNEAAFALQDRFIRDLLASLPAQELPRLVGSQKISQ